MSEPAIEIPAFSELVHLIYEASTDPSRWADVVKGAAALMGGSSSLVYGLQDARQAAGWAGHRFPGSAMDSYVQHYGHTNVWADEINRRRVPVGLPVITDELFDPRALERTEFYVDYLHALDIHRACTVLLHQDAEAGSESHLCVYRSRGSSPFDAEAADRLRLLVPHLQRAQRIGRTLAQLEGQACSAFAAIDALSAGVVMLSRAGAVVHANPAAKGMLDERDGLVSSRGRLSASRESDGQALAKLIHAACRWSPAPAGGAMQLFRPSGKRHLQVVVSPLTEAGGALVGADPRAVAMCLISGHERQLGDAQALLPALFGLTGAETRLAISLLAGHSIGDFAAVNGVSTNTAKTHLAGLFAKTGTHRQGEVVAVLRAACGHLHADG